MIDIALFFGWTYEAAGAWDGIRTIAVHMADGFLVKGLTGLTQLDPEVISRQLEIHGIGLPQEWNLANFADQAA